MIGTNPPSPQVFPPRNRRRHALTFAIAAALLPLFVFAPGCSSGGGGGGPAAAGPTIVAAAYTSGNSSPQVGDTLLLTFSADIQLRSGASLGDADFTLSSSGSLGAFSNVTVVSARGLQIELGTGVTFTIGTTTITLSADNDAIENTTGQLGTASTPVTIGTSDGAAPTLSNVTIAAVDGELNGTGTAGGTLQVPRSGWTIDLTFADNTGVDASATVITTDVVVTTTGGSASAGTNLTSQLTLASSNATTASFTVPSTVVFPATAFTLSCTVIDTSGLASTPASFTAQARDFNDNLRPFETNSNPSQVWYLDFDRDIESYTDTESGGTVTVAVNAGASGTADFIEILRVLGLITASPVAQTPPFTGNITDAVIDAYKTALLSDLATLFAGANISFTLAQPAGTISGSSVPYSSFGYSLISICGSADSTGNSGILGIAIFDPSNTTQDDNTLTTFQGSTRLGIFLHTMVASGLNQPGASAFRTTYDTFAPTRGNAPIGSDTLDGNRIDGTLSDGRATLINAAIQDFARFTAVVLAHEAGHSMGLVENGAMPTGLYGNDSTSFPGSADGHIRNTSLFPAGATNVMSPSLTYSSTVNSSSTFNSLNLAYLREQVFYGN